MVFCKEKIIESWWKILSKDLKIFDNKLIVLYILENAHMPLSITQIVKFCEDFDDITYFDICTYLDNLKSSNYIKEILNEGNILYVPTELGSNTLNELLELVPGVNLHNLKKLINKNAIEVKTDYSIDTTIIPIKSDEYKVSCYIRDGNDEMVNITIYAGTKAQAKNISKNWNENAEEIYTKLLDLMTK